MVSYKTAPDNNQKTWPSGIKYIVGNEGCERFSYYGMNAILYVYCVSLYSSNMPLIEAQAQSMATVHLFKTGVYALPMIGAILADRLLGKYRTILWLSFVYCLGHVALAFSEGSIFGLYLGLFLIALGSGGIKPCVSAHVGDQFGLSNWHLIPRVYQIFYFTINFGSFFSVLLIPLIQKWYGSSVAFLIPGILMFIATFIFWLGAKTFVHIPPVPGGKLGFLDTLCLVLMFLSIGSLFFTHHLPFWQIMVISLLFIISGFMVFNFRQRISQDDGFFSVSIFMLKEWFYSFSLKRRPVLILAHSGQGLTCVDNNITQKARGKFGEEALEGTKAVMRIISVFFMVSIFWALFDQHSSSWIQQASMMDLTLHLPLIGTIELLPSQIPSLNPVMVMLLIPFWAYIIEPFLGKFGIVLSPLKKMSLGMGLASLSFACVAILQGKIDELAPEKISVIWQLIPYLILTLAEVLVSITGLEFAYSQAPTRMKSTIMGFWLLTVALGNALVALLAHFSHIDLKQFFWIFSGLMALAFIVFALRASFYQIRDYRQK